MGLPPSGLELLSCGVMSARRTTDKRKTKGKMREEEEEEEGKERRAGRLWNHAEKVLWVQLRKEAVRMTVCHRIHCHHNAV